MPFMSSVLARAAFVLAACVAANVAQADPVKLKFTASGFQNAGTSYPGFDGEIDGSLTWDTANKADPIAGFLDIELEIGGHQYTLAEVGIANQSATETAIGALVRGANAVIGDGSFDDFLIIFDRVNPSIKAFAYSIQGKSSAIWWSPTVTSAAYVDVSTVPEPASLALVLPPLAWLAFRRPRKSC